MLAYPCLLAACVAMLCASTPADGNADVCDLVLSRCRERVLASRRRDVPRVTRYLEELSEDGRWADIDYDDRSPSSWRTVAHLSRVRDMAVALVSEESDLAGDAVLKDGLRRALRDWTDHRYEHTWWWTQIGVPQIMRDIVVVLGDRLKGDLRAGALEVIGHHEVRGSGANLVWSAELALHHACLEGRTRDAATAARRIWQEVVRGAAQGIQNDNSFYQHGPRLQAFHYGGSYARVVVDVAWQLRGTPWEMPEDKRDILSDYILEGLQWMCRGTYTVPSTLDRAVSRGNSLRASDLRGLLSLWREVDPERQEEIDAFIARQEGEGRPLDGYRHFPRADFSVYHQPDASVFLKTLSDRTRATESINSENLKGVPYLHSGDCYVLRDGLEYHNMQPVWDWRYLPGVTTAGPGGKVEQSPFVGGLSADPGGLTAMDYRRTDESGGTLSMRKAWFFFDDTMLCLMSEPRAPDAGPVRTALEQCRLRSRVWIGRAGRQPAVLAEGAHRFDDVRWLLHHGVGYLLAAPSTVEVTVGPVTGSWHSINHGRSDDPVTEPVFMAVLEHGPQPPATAYAVLLGADTNSMQAAASDPPWTVIHNDSVAQCVALPDGLHMAACYAPARIVEVGFETTRPCLAAWDRARLRVSDPTQTGGTATITLTGGTVTAELPDDGSGTELPLP